MTALATPFATAELAAIALCLIGMLILKIDLRRRPDAIIENKPKPEKENP